MTVIDGTTVIQEGVPVGTERIISRKIIDVTIYSVVRSIYQIVVKGFTIGGITVSFANPHEKAGKCYAKIGKPAERTVTNVQDYNWYYIGYCSNNILPTNRFSIK